MRPPSISLKSLIIRKRTSGDGCTKNKELFLFVLGLCCLMTRSAMVESFTISKISAAAAATVTTTTTSIIASAYIDTVTNLYLAQEDTFDKRSSGTISIKDDDGRDDKRTNYWKDIACYVFDTSVDTEMKDGNEDEDEKNNPIVAAAVQQHPHSKPIVLFDGVCNLCNDAANFVIDHDETSKFRFASLQSNVAKGLLLREGMDPVETSDVVLVTPTGAYYSSEAIAKIMTELDLPRLQLAGKVGQILPSFIRETIYKVVSGNRFVFGEKKSCRLDFDGDYISRFVSDLPASSSSLSLSSPSPSSSSSSSKS